MKAYNSGSKTEAIKNMVMCAIRDQQTLIEAYSHLDDADSRKAISDAENWIRDFERLGKLLAPK